MASTGASSTSIRVAGWLCIGLIGVGCLEFLGYQLLQLQLRNHHYLFEFPVQSHVAALDPGQIQAWVDGSGVYRADPLVGWRRTSGHSSTAPEGWTLTTDERGARHIPGQSGPIWLATFGDSFTECAEVDDDQTWQAALVDNLGGTILNFGVSGHGPDQAVIDLEDRLQRGLRPQVVILAMIEENLKRNLTAFRPYYTYPAIDFALGFKPMFVSTDQGFDMFRSWPADWADPASIEQAIVAAASFDLFAARRVESLDFPFTLSAARLIERQGWILDNWRPRESDRALQTMDHILGRFVDLSVAHGFVPVYVVLPSSGKEIDRRAGASNPLLAPLAAGHEARGLVYVDIVQALSGPEGRGLLQGLSTDQYLKIQHASADANRAVARAMLPVLTRIRLQERSQEGP